MPSDDGETPMKKYNENDFQADGIPTLDADDMEIQERGVPKTFSGRLLKWAEDRNNKPFPNRIKQLSCIKKMTIARYTEHQIKDCWEQLEKDEYWSEKGIDFGTVLTQIGKVKKSAGVTIL